MTTYQPDLVTALQLRRLAHDHPGAELDELARLAVAEIDAERAALRAIRSEARRRKAIIRRTGRPTGLPPLTSPDGS
jgi:hypothetical protein